MSLPESILSPLTGKPSSLTRRLPSAPIIAAYKEQFGYDASSLFVGIPEVGLYACDSGFRFYAPFSLSGPEALYRALEKFDWNYKEDKWEHHAALPFVKAGDRLLDVGCGEGNFLAKGQAVGATVSGIELNKQAAGIARNRGISVHEEMLSPHVPQQLYDVVTSFQVLEHVTDPLKFVTDSVRVLRPGGTLIIGVPNDDGFLRLDMHAVLNQPPHHMGLWNRKSLSSLVNLVDVNLLAFDVEPLAEHAWYQSVIETTYLTKFQRRLFHRLGFAKAFTAYVKDNAHTIAGHTIVAVYKKSSIDR